MQTRSFERQKKSGKLLEKLKVYGFIYALLIYPLVLFCIFYVGVNVNSVIMSFQKFHIDGSKSFCQFENFVNFFDKAFLQDNILRTSIINAVIIWVFNFIISMPLYIVFSYLIFKKAKGHALYRLLFMLPSIVSGMVYLLVFKQFVGSAIPSLMADFGVLDIPDLLQDDSTCFTTCMFYSIWTSFAVSLITYPNAMNGIDQGIIESAQLDGVSNMYQELWYIILPLIYPTITTFIIMGVAGIFSAGFPLIGLYGFNAPAKVYTFNYYYTVQIMTAKNNLGYPELAAGGLIMTAIIAPTTMIVKYLMEKFSPVKDGM